MMPTICQLIMKKNDFELAETVINVVFRQIYVPFGVLYVMLVIISSIVVMICIAIGMLPLPLFTMVLNPLVIRIIGLLFRATKCKLFIDAPSCCAASIGLVMYGVLAVWMYSLG